MRKLALLVAATLVVSTPILMTPSTETFAAAKAKKKGSEADQNFGFFNAFSDQASGSNSAVDKGSAKSKSKAKNKKAQSKKGGKAKAKANS